MVKNGFLIKFKLFVLFKAILGHDGGTQKFFTLSYDPIGNSPRCYCMVLWGTVWCCMVLHGNVS